jgi:hypothetical protein
MKMNKFTLGAIAGIVTVALAVPLLAQISSAATSGAPKFTRPVPTQQQVQDMVARDDAFLKNVDAMVTVQKTATQAHEAALTAAASITDDTQRQAAVQKANDDERTAIQNAITANPDLKSAMMPFGGGRGFGEGKGGMMGRGPNTASLATKLGMTETDLKAALDGGKTIQQIAQEHGVTLPARTGGKHGGWMMGNGSFSGTTTSSASLEQ